MMPDFYSEYIATIMAIIGILSFDWSISNVATIVDAINNGRVTIEV